MRKCLLSSCKPAGTLPFKMPPRPNPLEEPVFSVDLATNQQRFYATGEWENITGTFGNSTLARVLFGVLAKAAQLHKDNLKDFPDFLKFLLSNHDIEDTGSVGEWVTKRGIFVGNSIVGLVSLICLMYPHFRA